MSGPAAFSHRDVVEALDAIDVVSASAAAVVPASQLALVRCRMARLLGVTDARPSAVADPRLEQLGSWPTSPLFSVGDWTLLGLAEQFVLDVDGVTDDQRAEVARVFGPLARTWPSVLYAVDAELRVTAVLRELFETTVHFGTAAPWPLDKALNEMTRLLARLSGLDPLTTELVRLRGARVHNCRMCKALRHADALDAGGGEEVFDQIDDYENSDLDERHRVALRLTDAVLFSPGWLPEGLVDQVLWNFAPSEVVEIVLDVERNARNKVAVTNGTDGDGVTDGLTLYTIDEEGRFDLVDTGPGASDPRGRF